MITLCLILPIWDKSFGTLGEKLLATIIVLAIDALYIVPMVL